MQYGIVTIHANAGPSPIVVGDPNRKKLEVRNVGTAAVWIGDRLVAIGNGLRLGPYETPFTTDDAEGFYAVCDGAVDVPLSWFASY